MPRDTVLVIDDDPDFRELMPLMLEPLGMTVIGAEDCAAGLACFERERPRLRAVLLDYFMPGMTPRDCAAAILRRAAPDVPVVLVTAAVDAASRAAELGCRRWLAKPFTPEDLERVLTET